MSRVAGMGNGRWIMITFAAGMILLRLAAPASGGPYRDSAHGNSAYGVNRTAIDVILAEYATGNCAHCHEMHASIEGVEPEPRGGAMPHALFSGNFNSTRPQNLYVESDNFCFSCHSSTAGQRVRNQDYSGTFGGATVGSGPQSILDAFNQSSYHNLYDIWNLLLNSPSYPWFKPTTNPCSACHNAHLAKRNWDSSQPGFPLLSAISRPGSYSTLWGETELMGSYLSYEAPYAFGEAREPAGVGQADGDKTPDYVTFCTSCHNPSTTVWSTTLNREVGRIDWGSTGEKRDKHGAEARDGATNFRQPYGAAAPFKSNFVLSCLDCHEPHGSTNIMLLRRRINGEDLEGTVAANETVGYACRRCHQDDLLAAAGTGEANRWEYVHHGASGAPYAKSGCSDCHTAGDGSPISCGSCHGHGMDDSWAGTRKTGRKTF